MSETLYPPVRPRRTVSNSVARSSCSAARMVGRLVPNSSASSGSGGNRSPGRTEPFRIQSLIEPAICCGAVRTTGAGGRVSVTAIDLNV